MSDVSGNQPTYRASIRVYIRARDPGEEGPRMSGPEGASGCVQSQAGKLRCPQGLGRWPRHGNQARNKPTGTGRAVGFKFKNVSTLRTKLVTRSTFGSCVIGPQLECGQTSSLRQRGGGRSLGAVISHRPGRPRINSRTQALSCKLKQNETKQNTFTAHKVLECIECGHTNYFNGSS